MVATDCDTPSVELLLKPVRSTHWAPSCAGNDTPFWLNDPLTVDTAWPAGPKTVQPVSAPEPTGKLVNPPTETIGASKLPFVSRFACAGTATRQRRTKANCTLPSEDFMRSPFGEIRRCTLQLSAVEASKLCVPQMECHFAEAKDTRIFARGSPGWREKL